MTPDSLPCNGRSVHRSPQWVLRESFCYVRHVCVTRVLNPAWQRLARARASIVPDSRASHCYPGSNAWCSGHRSSTKSVFGRDSLVRNLASQAFAFATCSQASSFISSCLNCPVPHLRVEHISDGLSGSQITQHRITVEFRLQGVERTLVPKKVSITMSAFS